MFDRAHHRRIALLLSALDGDVLRAHRCYFGGGTAIALRFGEYRESADVDFLVSQLDGYRGLRSAITSAGGLAPIMRHGFPPPPHADIRADQYGIRTRVLVEDIPIKFEIVHEGRISFDEPSATDEVCAVATLAPVDLAASKLLANSDRWADDSVFSRDLIDLAMMVPSRKLVHDSVSKAETAYGEAVVRDLKRAIERLAERKGRLQQCADAMSINVPTALIWERIRRLRRLAPAAP